MKKKQRLIRRTTAWLLVAIMLPSCLLAVFVGVSSVRNAINEQTEECNTLLGIMSQSILGHAKMVENAVEVLSYDDGVHKLLAGKNMSKYRRMITQLYDVQPAIANFTTFLMPLDAELVLFTADETVPESYWSVLHLSNARTTEDYQLFEACGEMAKWVGKCWVYPPNTIIRSADNKKMFCYYRMVCSGLRQTAGVLKCGVPFKSMFSILDSQDFSGDIYVVQNGDVLYGSANAEFPLEGVDVLKLTREHHGGYFYTSKTIESLGISLALRQESSRFFTTALMSGLPQILAALLAGLVLVLVTRSFFRSIQRRLDQAVFLAQEARHGNLAVVFSNPEQDEIGELIQSFNALMQQLRQTAQEKIQHEKETKRVMRLALQYQVNPHFLFNTLNWLQMAVEMQTDSEQISDAISLLGKLLRYNLKGAAMTTLAEEVMCLNNYISLMNMRRHEAIALETTLEELEPDMPIMRFLFQPICENAIQHGARPGQTLRVRLHGYRTETSMVFSFENDGMEIEPERLKSLNEILRNAQPHEGVGLTNIRKRLALTYGAEAGMYLTSDAGKTTVTLRYPDQR